MIGALLVNCGSNSPLLRSRRPRLAASERYGLLKLRQEDFGEVGREAEFEVQRVVPAREIGGREVGDADPVDPGPEHPRWHEPGVACDDRSDGLADRERTNSLALGLHQFEGRCPEFAGRQIWLMRRG